MRKKIFQIFVFTGIGFAASMDEGMCDLNECIAGCWPPHKAELGVCGETEDKKFYGEFTNLKECVHATSSTYRLCVKYCKATIPK